MTNISQPRLCGVDGCRLLSGHRGRHNSYPSIAWNFMDDKDKNKLNKAGFATPRGGDKGAYQNHVSRNSQVIVPFEKLPIVDLSNYSDGYVIRLYPDQYFSASGVIKDNFVNGPENWISVGRNAFVHYRFHDQLDNFPPLSSWEVRGLEKGGKIVTTRGKGVRDTGHYTLRIPNHGQKEKNYKGAVQGIFAPEYATVEINYLSKCVLAWLIVHTENSPYTTKQAAHLKAILAQDELLKDELYEYKGTLRRGLCACPLCMRFIRYEDLHKMALFNDESSEDNAGIQVEGATRSTIVNLFHLAPLKYGSISHIPSNIGWGHHVCNTRLGQRACLSLAQLIEMNRKVAIIGDQDYLETLGWISDDDQMIRSPDGAVWIQIVNDMIIEASEDTPPGIDEMIILDDVSEA